MAIWCLHNEAGHVTELKANVKQQVNMFWLNISRIVTDSSSRRIDIIVESFDR